MGFVILKLNERAHALEALLCCSQSLAVVYANPKVEFVQPLKYDGPE